MSHLLQRLDRLQCLHGPGMATGMCSSPTQLQERCMFSASLRPTLRAHAVGHHVLAHQDQGQPILSQIRRASTEGVSSSA